MFDRSCYPKYDELTRIEKVFLRTCCYYPPFPRRIRKHADVISTELFCSKYEESFGPEIWKLIKGKKVLDLGCGEGQYILSLAEKGASVVVGLDILPGFTFAKQEAINRGYKNAFFVQGTIFSLQDSFFDVVISHDSFEHFAQPEKIFAEILRVTKENGYILINFGPLWRGPYGRHMSGTIRRDRPWIHLVVPEKIVMRCHSVYHNEPSLKEKYSQLSGGLNKMTLSKFNKILNGEKNIEILQYKIFPIKHMKWLTLLPILREFFVIGIFIKCKKR